MDISSESYEEFSYIDVNKKHQRHVPFTRALFHICIDSSDIIIIDSDTLGSKNILLCNNMMKLLLLKD